MSLLPNTCMAIVTNFINKRFGTSQFCHYCQNVTHGVVTIGGHICTSLPSSIGWGITTKCTLPISNFPPFAMNALNAWICTTKPLLHPPPTKRGSKLYTLFHLTLPLFRFALRGLRIPTLTRFALPDPGSRRRHLHVHLNIVARDANEAHLFRLSRK